MKHLQSTLIYLKLYNETFKYEFLFTNAYVWGTVNSCIWEKKSNPKAFTTNAICFTHNSSQILHPLLEDGTSDEISDGKEKDLKKVCISVL